MNITWKFLIPQMCVAAFLGVTGFILINSSFTNMREQYTKDFVEGRLQHIIEEIDASAQESVRQTSVFVRLPVVIQAYEIALGGNINDPYSPQSQTARELLRKELAPMLDSHREATGEKLRLHFHLPNGFSLARLWREKQANINGEWVDISDDLHSYRQMVIDVNKSGKAAIGIEPGSGGFAIRGVIPVRAPDGRLLGSAEVLQSFDSILEAITDSGRNFAILYANKDLLSLSMTMQNTAKYPRKDDFVRISEIMNGAIESLITPELLSRGKDGRVFENHGSMTLATLPIADYKGKQVGMIVCAVNTGHISTLADTAKVTLIFVLAA